MARTELGEGGTVLPGKGGLFFGEVGGLKVENLVEWRRSDGSVHIFSVQLLPCLLSVLDSSVADESFI